MPALEGIRVVDVSGTVATTYAAKLFTDYGAEVINIETEGGFPTRTLAPMTVNNLSAMHGYLNAGKKSIQRDHELNTRLADLVSAAHYRL